MKLVEGFNVVQYCIFRWSVSSGTRRCQWTV